MKRFWRDMVTTDFDDDTSNWIAVLPLAAIEQHGPHLPLGVDAMIAEALVNRCAAALGDSSPAVFLPLQSVGKSNEHVNFPGTLSLNWETAIKSWIEIGASVAAAGVRKIVLITSHGGNVSSMDIVARELREKYAMMAVTTSWNRLADWRAIYEGEDLAIDIHAGEVETSLMLAIRPDLVDMKQAADFESTQTKMASRNNQLGWHSSRASMSWLAEDLNKAGAVGNASLATKEKGEKDLRATVDGFCRLVDEIEKTPAPQG